jgi:hypothetical protein
VFLLVAIVLGVVTVPFAGGQLARVPETRLRASPEDMAALGVEARLPVGTVAPGTQLGAGHVRAYAAAAFFVAANRRIAGVALLGLGGALNALAIVANGGIMPAAASAVERAGLVHDPGRFHNSAIVEDARLAYLGDIFALPASVPLSNVFSVGDVLLFAAGATIVHALAGSPWTRRLRPASAWRRWGQSADARKRVADQHVDHAMTAEGRPAQHASRRLVPHLADDGGRLPPGLVAQRFERQLGLVGSTVATPPRVASRRQCSRSSHATSSAAASGHRGRVSLATSAAMSSSPRASMIATP